MPRSIAAGLVLTAVLIALGGGARADHCNNSGPAVSYEPPPVYVYDHSTGPRWTGNGWAYLPIGAYRPRPEELPPPPVPLAHGFCSQSFLAPILEPVLPPVVYPILVPLLPSWSW
jgi:hypothetical protein